ncbi:MAG: hypothetical protein KJO01_04875 [Gammaproteobacteria bacterium]|nr:hypothetical protein [Gammaproteobacteria bacterium]MBT8111202.1 hypothetical protein [Gammaproteobacteria bacterium]NND46835.1 hypothetical protein [Woeseiaceae bacterium]NNL45900.1 hypothetical protein [Woeseiaceae bacterium]
MTKTLLRPSAIVLILANMVPLVGVLLFDWRVFDILMLYWAENVVIGVVNVLRMSTSRAGIKWFLMPFFVVHYGIFCFGHLAAVTGLFSESMGTETAWRYFFGLPIADAWKSPLWIGIAAIAASHLFSFFANFIAKGEYRRTNVNDLMQRPYGRIIVLHVAIIFGAALIQWLGSPVMMLVVLVAAKIALDLRLHLAEREKFAAGLVTP